jgi:7-cyano-7-deazaguanine synthase
MIDAAVALTSGGLDSTTVLAMARREGREIYCLTLDYGQTHRLELEAARRVAKALGARRHVVGQVPPAVFDGSALTGGPPPPRERSEEEIATGPIPATYVPARNTVFLSLALAWAETLGLSDILIGVNALDYSGYPDCRPEFIEAFERLARLATRAGVEQGKTLRVHTPLIHMTKGEIIRAGLDLGVDYSLTHSCYFPAEEGLACGVCDSCRLRLKGFAEAGARDPLRYAPR